MKKQLIYWLAAFVIVVVGCQKELSFEGSNAPAKGSLKSDATGDCLPKTVNGTYMATNPLVPTTNTISVQVNVSTTGSYVVGTDTVNGYYFRAVGIFTTLGINNVTLRGYGTPFTGGVNNFVVSFDTTFCDIQVTVISPGVGTLGGSPNACAPIIVNGGYSPGVALTASNNADIQVNVTTPGFFNITTDTIDGIWFNYAGNLTTPGPQTVTLLARGSLPAATATGTKTFTVKLGTGRCTFPVIVAAPAAGTVDCTAAVVSGTYTLAIPLVPATNTVQISVNVTTIGAYNITTDTVNGIWFNASGTFTATGNTPLTLAGHGTPTGSGGSATFTVKFTPSTCTFSVTIGNGLGAYTPDCTTAVPDLDGLYEVGTQLNCSNTVDIDVDVTALGPYSITTTATNGMTFSASGTFTTLGVQTIKLQGSGTPTAAATPVTNIPMPGTVPCTFPITVDPAPVVDWNFTKTNAPATIYRGQTDAATLLPVPPGVIFTLQGSNSFGSDQLVILLSDANGIINNGETYSTSALLGNQAAFSYTLATSANCADIYSADLTISGVSITFTVTSHNILTQTITGTFTGTAKNVAAQTLTITTGTFTGTY